MTAPEHVATHYDAGNDLFALFLDRRYRVYSCGVWEGVSSLEDAQVQKLRRLADYAAVAPGDRVLDIGCGWGGMLDFCVNVRNARRAVGLTISSEQESFIRQCDLPRTEVHLSSWDDFRSVEPFDSIISIGAFEHFASLQDVRNNQQTVVYRAFFQRCYDLSTPTAALGLQTIVTERAPNTIQSMKDTHFLLQRVFPGSALPRIDDVVTAAQDLFEPGKMNTIGADYAQTLQAWKARFTQNKEHILNVYGPDVWVHYNNYFDAAIRSFENGYVNLLQISFIKTPRPTIGGAQT